MLPYLAMSTANFGEGVVGGPAISTQELGRRAAEAAVRILNGERAGDIRLAAVGLGTPAYDWRELQRWNISEARLPPGSIVQFRVPTVWEHYRWLLIGIFHSPVGPVGDAQLAADRAIWPPQGRSANPTSDHWRSCISTELPR